MGCLGWGMGWSIGKLGMALHWVIPVGAMILGMPGHARAQNATIPLAVWDKLLIDPPAMDMFSLDYESPDPRIVTSLDASEEGLTIPSLWWAQQLYGGRLLEHWVALPPEDGLPRRVDLVVNEQVWSIYDYIERYTFVNRLGMEAEEFGYITRVFDRSGSLLSAYVCDFQTIASPQFYVDSECHILLDAQGVGGLMGQSRSGASPSTGDGRFQR